MSGRTRTIGSMRQVMANILCAVAVLVLATCKPGAPATGPATTASATMTAGPRIVSVVPAATLNLVLIGAADRLVGVTKYDQDILPEAQKNLAVVEKPFTWEELMEQFSRHLPAGV